MKDYKFSVIIPAYNSEAFIGETVECLLSQTLKDVQIIIVNDGSKDGTGVLIDTYAAEHDNIIAVHQPNGGVSSARNHGLEFAAGKYLLFNDSDDLLGGDTLERIYNRLESTGADMGIIRMRRFGFGSEEDNPIAKELSEEEFIDCFDKRLLWNFLIGNKAFRTEKLLESGVRFPSTKYSEDGAFNMSFIYAARPKITGVPGAVAKYRRCDPEEHPSVTQSISMEYIRDYCTSMDIITAGAEKALEEVNLAPESKKEYLEELLRKRYCTLMNEFYRLLWGADDETLSFLSEKCRDIRSRLAPASIKQCDEQYKDLGIAVSSRREAADAPAISVKVRAKHISPAFIRSLYHQSMPLFELLTKEKVEGDFENIRSFSEKPKGKTVISLSGKKPVDSRLLRVIFFLKAHPKFRIFPDFLIKHGAFLFLKFKK